MLAIIFRLSFKFQSALSSAQSECSRILPFREKDGRTEFMLDDPFDQACVRSLFPHFGDSPCWYLERERNKRKNI